MSLTHFQCHCHCQVNVSCLSSFINFLVLFFIFVTGVWLITRQFLNATFTLKWNKWTNISLLRRYHVGKRDLLHLAFLVFKVMSGKVWGYYFSLLQWQIWCRVQNVVVNLWSPLNILLFWWWGVNFVDFQFHPAQFVKKVGQRMCLLRSKKSLWITNSIFNWELCLVR